MLNSSYCILNVQPPNAADVPAPPTGAAWGLGGALNTGAINAWQDSSYFRGELVGASIRTESFAGDGSGRHDWVYTRYEGHEAAGAATWVELFVGTLGSGHSSWDNITRYDADGVGCGAQYEACAGIGIGAQSNYATTAGMAVGRSAIALQQWTAEGCGAETWNYATYAGIGSGYAYVMASWDQTMAGYHRVADDALAGYELYRTVDGATFDFDTPWETFASLPHDTAALDAGHTYRFVLRQRNAYRLCSKNIEYTEIIVDDAGEETGQPPSAPEEITIKPAAHGAVTVTAIYHWLADGEELAADTWLVYLDSEGAPDPDNAAPIEVAISRSEALARLRYTSAPFADVAESATGALNSAALNSYAAAGGVTVHALVRVRRTGPPLVDSTNTATVSTAIETEGPEAPEGWAFFARVGATHGTH